MASPAATSTPTQDPQAAHVATYATIAAKGAQAVAQADAGMAGNCGSGDFSNCRTALQNLVTKTQAFDSSLATATVPLCLDAVNQELRLGLQIEVQGAKEGISGMDASDAAQITAGGDLINQAAIDITTAAEKIPNAAC